MRVSTWAERFTTKPWNWTVSKPAFWRPVGLPSTGSKAGWQELLAELVSRLMILQEESSCW
jgi:hypothetical protein